MSKEIIYNPQACASMVNGMNQVAQAAAVTYGHNGPLVMLQHQTDGIAPVFTRDGVSVVKSINLSDRNADLGARMLRDAAGTLSRQVGDGTTTAIILTQALAKSALKRITAGYHPLQITRGMESALALVLQQLKRYARHEIGDAWVEQIAAVATKGDDMVGSLLTQAFQTLGVNASVDIQMGNGRQDELEIVNGVRFDQGYLSPYFITDKNRSLTVLERPYLLFYDRQIHDFIDLIPILEAVKEQGRPLLIIAEDIVDKALTGLLLNHVRGVFVTAAVKPPGYGDKRIDRIKDLALMTGGKACLQETEIRLQDVCLEDLGQAERIVISEDETTIIGANSNPALVRSTVTALQQQAERVRQRKPGQGSPTGNQHELDELETRIAQLDGKTAVYSVGGVTDIEIKERMVRIENAYCSIRAALQEGVLAGGGAAMLRSRESLSTLLASSDGMQQGIQVMHEALSAPLTILARNSGLNAEAIMQILSDNDNVAYCCDMRSGEYDTYDINGVMDSVKVLRLALSSAVSIVSTMMTTETVIMDVPDKSIMDGYSPEWAAATREDPRV